MLLELGKEVGKDLGKDLGFEELVELWSEELVVVLPLLEEKGLDWLDELLCEFDEDACESREDTGVCGSHP